jgi:hypothetical protein
MYQPPAQGYGAAPAGPIVVASGVIQERSSALVIVLALFTCGIYHLIWIYKTGDELRAATNDPQINPGMDVLLTIITCGVWALFVYYRNIQKAHAALRWREPYREDKSQTVLILSIVGLFVGVTTIVAMYMVQEELNALARSANAPALLPA